MVITNYMRRKVVDKIKSEQAFEQIVEQYQHLVFSICYKMTNDYFASEDLTQETFFSAYAHLDSFTGDQMKSWICRIASNKCIDYLKNSSRRQIPTEDDTLSLEPSHTMAPEQQAEEQEVYDTLRQRCESLRPPYDEIAILHYCRECTPEEIARQKNSNLKTIQTQIYRARGMLRKLYEKERIHHG